MGPRSGVRLAAADGTVAAWVYGDNRADSGSGSALNKDEVHFSARWAGGRLVGGRQEPGALGCAVPGLSQACLLAASARCAKPPLNMPNVPAHLAAG